MQDDLGGTPLRPTTRAIHIVPSQRRHPTMLPRRPSSAPDLRASGSTSLDEPSSSSFTRSSVSAPGLRHDTQDRDVLITPVAPVHHAERVRATWSATEPSHTLEQPRQEPPTLDSASRTLEEVHRVIREMQRRRRRSGPRGLWITIRAFFGYGPDGSAARRDFVSLIGKMLFGAGQIGAIIGVLSIAAVERSPTDNAVNEWQACRRPLGLWCAFWCVRVVLGCLMAFWEHRRKIRRSIERAERTDGQAANDDVNDNRPPSSPRRSTLQRTEAETRQRISAVTFARLTTMLSLISLTWFVTAHVLIYTSIHSCRASAPHLWWLTFGIICIGYLVVVEVIIVTLIVFILGPLIFLLLNLILICMGRQPLRHPTHINPEIGKLPQKSVDLIPLVLYIPAPVAKETTMTGDTPQGSSTSPAGQSQNAPVSSMAVSEAPLVHSYPPAAEKQTASSLAASSGTSQRSRHLFTFRRIRLKKPAKSDAEKGKEKQTEKKSEERGDLYEDKWERGEYPFVKLEGNRAACAICLCDFEAPRRVRYSIDSKPAEDLDQEEKGVSGSTKNAHQDGRLRLTDPGEGAQPLRLLACAHVFHKSCLDPWLTEVSGRCPVCQRPVDVADPAKPDRQRQRTQGDEGE